jgi:predicted nucleic acid-binding protein
MFERLLIADSGPLIGLAKIGRLGLLPQLAEHVVIPPAVWREAVLSRPEAPDAKAVALVNWLEVQPVDGGILASLPEQLDPGEAEAIALALRFPGARLLIDDRLGRREAARLGLIFFGVNGLLKEAKLRGLIPLLGPELTSLLEAEYHLSPQLVADALRSVGEPPLP